MGFPLESSYTSLIYCTSENVYEIFIHFHGHFIQVMLHLVQATTSICYTLMRQSFIGGPLKRLALRTF